MRIVSALLAGVVFGLGLVISGMANPAKVLNFLDLFGAWDPSLAFVMGGAIAVTLPGYAVLRGRNGPVFADAYQWPTRSDLDARLIAGAAVFGVGWGLGGFCPGPAIVAIPIGATGALIFVAAMLAGMWLARMIGNARRREAAP